MKLKYLIKGFVKSIPGIEYVYNFDKSTGGTDNARYCYSVWLRHLVHGWHNGVNKIPRKIAELGPGDSLGVGLCALICGAEKYFALDIVKFANTEKNLSIFEELISLFKQRSPIPGVEEFPLLKPDIETYDFPFYIFSSADMDTLLDEVRLQKIRDSIIALSRSESDAKDRMIQYKAPWHHDEVIEAESVDMIISQAALQHIDHLEDAYRCMNKWLKKGGMMSHCIDFKSMGSSDIWDGHWAYSDWEWKIVRGRKTFFINREPYSTHMKYLEQNGFTIICNKKTLSPSSFNGNGNRMVKFRNLSHEDLITSGTFIQALK